LTPLHAVYFAKIVSLHSVGILQPLFILIGILIPHLATKSPEICGAFICAKKADQFPDSGLECEPLGGNRWKPISQIEAHHGTRNGDGSYSRTVLLSGA